MSVACLANHISPAKLKKTWRRTCSSEPTHSLTVSRKPSGNSNTTYRTTTRRFIAGLPPNRPPGIYTGDSGWAWQSLRILSWWWGALRSWVPQWRSCPSPRGSSCRSRTLYLPPASFRMQDVLYHSKTHGSCLWITTRQRATRVQQR